MRAVRIAAGLLVAGLWVALSVWLTSMTSGDMGSWIGTIAGDGLCLCAAGIGVLIAVVSDEPTWRTKHGD